MPTQIYAANLPMDAREEEVQELFTPHGAVMETKLIVDRTAGDKRLCAIVTMADEAAAKEAIRQLNGQRLQDQDLEVCERDKVEL